MKKKIYLKMVAMTLLLLLSITAVLSASYAWFVLSENPAVSGIQVSLSGGGNILIAADLTTTVNGVTYHYPDAFSETLNFGTHSSYSYLQDLGGLSPVSTADGRNWFIATFYNANDEAVKSGWASAGELRPVQEFELDNTLYYANQGKDSADLTTGHYVYLDFWVVAPGADYTLRISTSEEGGTYVVDLLDPEATTATSSGYTLSHNGITSTAATTRVGFLTSSEQVTDYSMLYYQKSHGYDSRYTSLRGVYAEQGSETIGSGPTNFVIYEPNADAHPTGAVEEGSFAATWPLGLVGGVPTPSNVLKNTTVQLTNRWSTAANGKNLMIEQIFQTALYANQDYATDSARFYSKYLGGQLSAYIDKGAFIKNTSSLSDTVSANRLSTIQTADATEDVHIIELERNVPQRIRMYIWLESQDVDWDPTAAGNSFALSIEFAGGTD